MRLLSPQQWENHVLQEGSFSAPPCMVPPQCCSIWPGMVLVGEAACSLSPHMLFPLWCLFSIWGNGWGAIKMHDRDVCWGGQSGNLLRPHDLQQRSCIQPMRCTLRTTDINNAHEDTFTLSKKKLQKFVEMVLSLHELLKNYSKEHYLYM